MRLKLQSLPLRSTRAPLPAPYGQSDGRSDADLWAAVSDLLLYVAKQYMYIIIILADLNCLWSRLGRIFNSTDQVDLSVQDAPLESITMGKSTNLPPLENPDDLWPIILPSQGGDGVFGASPEQLRRLLNLPPGSAHTTSGTSVRSFEMARGADDPIPSNSLRKSTTSLGSANAFGELDCFGMGETGDLTCLLDDQNAGNPFTKPSMDLTDFQRTGGLLVPTADLQFDLIDTANHKEDRKRLQRAPRQVALIDKETMLTREEMFLADGEGLLDDDYIGDYGCFFEGPIEIAGPCSVGVVPVCHQSLFLKNESTIEDQVNNSNAVQELPSGILDDSGACWNPSNTNTVSSISALLPYDEPPIRKIQTKSPSPRRFRCESTLVDQQEVSNERYILQFGIFYFLKYFPASMANN